MLTLLFLSLCVSAYGVYKYAMSARTRPVQTTVWEQWHMVTLQTESGSCLKIIQALWYTQDITDALQAWCHDTGHVAFMATDSVLFDITGLQKPKETADPYLTVIYQ